MDRFNNQVCWFGEKFTQNLVRRGNKLATIRKCSEFAGINKPPTNNIITLRGHRNWYPFKRIRVALKGSAHDLSADATQKARAVYLTAARGRPGRRGAKRTSICTARDHISGHFPEAAGSPLHKGSHSTLSFCSLGFISPALAHLHSLGRPAAYEEWVPKETRRIQKLRLNF